ncbi:Sugar carrier protein A [Morus notabilis]|uniref:Sugar carrier protein A n=1 Tax=Morus notabilis TaxID=981085 RepID=W9SRE3_9ROSA|nr:Sugar carrier protein A [Morus notabilis]
MFNVKQIIIATILGVKLGDHQDLSSNLSMLVMVAVCLFALAFGWSWDPLAWTIPSEIFPLETRSAGHCIGRKPSGAPIQEMTSEWGKHWFWTRMLPAYPEVDGNRRPRNLA